MKMSTSKCSETHKRYPEMIRTKDGERHKASITEKPTYWGTCGELGHHSVKYARITARNTHTHSKTSFIQGV